MVDDIAERVRKLGLGHTTIRSIGHVARLKGLEDSDAEYMERLSMLAEVRSDNEALLERIFESIACATTAMTSRLQAC